MAAPISLFRPVAGERIDPTSIDATGATLGHVLTAVSDGSGGQRAGYAAPGGSSYTDENAQDAVGGILDDGGDIDFTYDDATPKITALVKARAVTWAKVQAMTSGKLLGRSTASSGDVEEITVGSGLSLSSGTLSATGGTSSVDVRKNSTGSTFTRPRINLIEGSNVTLTVADDGTDNEVDVTIAASGGGSTLYSKWDPDVPDSSPHSITKEFDSSDLSAWTVVNSRGTIDADTTAKGKLFMSLPSQLYRYVAYLRAIPGDTNWTMHTKVWVAAKPSSAVLAVAGFVISDTNTTNTGKQSAIAFGHSEDGPAYRQAVTWDAFGETPTGAGASTYRTTSHHCYIRVRKNSGTYYCAWSGDGETWWETTFTIYGGITPAYIGLYAQNYTGYDASFSFEYFRYYANGTQYRTGAAANVLG